MRIQEQPAYILHHRAFRDTSQILEVLSRDHGRLSLMSKGSLSAKSRLKAVLQPFQPLLLSWSGKGEMQTLTSAEPQSALSIKLKGKALPSAFYINELLMHLLPRHDVNEQIYGLYESVLALLADSHPVEPVLRLYEKQLLESLGFGLILDHTADTAQPVLPERDYAYYLEHGPLEFSQVKDEAYIARVSGKSLLDLQNNTLETIESLRDAKRLMRQVLNYYLAGKTLKSRDLFR